MVLNPFVFFSPQQTRVIVIFLFWPQCIDSVEPIHTAQILHTVHTITQICYNDEEKIAHTKVLAQPT